MFKKIINMAWESSGLKKGEFAKLCGVSRQMMSRYLEGKSKPDFSRGAEIIKKCGYEIKVAIPLSDKEYFDLNGEEKTE